MNKNIPITELIYRKSKPIDQLNITDGVALMVEEQAKASLEVQKSCDSIRLAIERIVDHIKFNNQGRLIYVGAGTSGRIAVQDGVELFPTFNWPKERLDFIIAGGKESLLNSIENAEDNINSADEMVKFKHINSQDVVIGLAASGNTPFTCKVMEEAKKKKALTIAVSNNPTGKILEFGDIKILLNTKEEVIAGSTRLKAGTAQKICLNIISSMVMVRLGRVKNGLMNEMVPTNNKLRSRKNMINSKNI